MGDSKKLPRQDRKVFCGGLPTSTDKKILGDYFCQFGDLEDAHVMIDGASGQSRGFGFVVFQELSAMEECLEQEVHIVDGKEIEVKKAVPKEEQKTKKVFLGGLDPDTTEEEIKEAFSNTGMVGVKIMTEKGTEKPRGFAFAFFDEFESVDNVVARKKFTVKNRQVEVKKAVPRDEMDRGKKSFGGHSRADSPPPPHHHHRHHHRDPYMYGHPMDYRLPYDYYPRMPEMYGRMSPHHQYSSSFARYPPGYGYDMYPSARNYGGYMGSPSSLGNNYSQSSSGYGPSRGSYEQKEQRSMSRSGGYHPYSRR